MDSTTNRGNDCPPALPIHETFLSPEHEGGVPLVRWLVLQRICPNRKAAADSIQNQGCVLINGQQCTSLGQLVYDTDLVEFRGNPIKKRRIEHLYYILHKPPNCLCSRRNRQQVKGGQVVDDDRPCVYDFIPEHDRPYLNSIGRLDIDTTGLLLFTSDGMLHNALASPEYKVEKIYRCNLRTSEPLSEQAIQQLQDGVQLPHAKGAVVSGIARNVSENGVVDLCITGGYKHQVKLMLALVQRPLRLLHRTSFASLELPTDLKEGECRTLTRDEVDHLYSLAKKQLERFDGQMVEKD
jgi:16S rRNA pseudouridine516 synthase